jgi:hypothetical protein
MSKNGQKSGQNVKKRREQKTEKTNWKS